MMNVFIKMLSCMNGYAMALIFVFFVAGMFIYIMKIDNKKKTANKLKGKFKIDNLLVSKTELEMCRSEAAETEVLCKNLLNRVIGLMLASVIVYTAILSFRIIGKANTNPNDFIYTFSFCLMLLWMTVSTCGMMVARSDTNDFLRVLNIELGDASKKCIQDYTKLLEEEVESMNEYLLHLENEGREPTMFEVHNMIESVSLVNRATKEELQ